MRPHSETRMQKKKYQFLDTLGSTHRGDESIMQS